MIIDTFKKVLSLILTVFLISSCSIRHEDTTKDNESLVHYVIIENARISYLGPQGTYTEEAAQLFFDQPNTFIPETTVVDAVNDLIDKTADYAVIPQENTLGGAVSDYVDTLIKTEGIYVVGEIILPISQTLMGIDGASLADIETVCSHAQGLSQSKQWLKDNLPDAQVKEMESTAAAAKFVAESNDKSIAAIAAPGAAGLYGLSILAENVQIVDTNKTRFYVLAASMSEGSGHKNAAFVATCKAERIDDIIIEMHDSGLELVTIHDRPEGSDLGFYNYLIEVEDPDGISDKQLEKLLKIPELHYLGSFEVKIK